MPSGVQITPLRLKNVILIKSSIMAGKSKALKTAQKKVSASKKAGTYIGAAKLKNKLVASGKSESYAGAIVGKIAREKYGKAGAAALAAAGRKKKK